MALFQAQKGFTHFVFADPKDSYILPGLVRLDLNGYLYYILKEQGYESVLFVSGLESPFRLELYDEASRSLYLSHGRKSGGFWSKGTQDRTEDPRVYQLSEDLPKRLINLLKKSSDTAFVFRLDSFYEIFNGNRGLLREFVRTGQRYLEQNGSILVLQMPLSAGGSLGYLTDPKGIFSDMDGISLCPEVTLILERNQDVKLYEALEREMGERCVFLEQFTFDKIQLMVRAAFLTDPEWDWSEADVKDVAAFIDSWHSSECLRQQVGRVLSTEDSRPAWTLINQLSIPHERWKVLRVIRQWDTKGQPLRQYLREAYPPDPESPRILADNQLAKAMGRICVPQELYGGSPELGKVILGRFQELVREYQTPRSRPCDKGLDDVLCEYIQILEKAAQRGDRETFERSVRFLDRAVESGFRFGAEDCQGWSIRTTILRLSVKLFELDSAIGEDTRQIASLEQRKKLLIEEVRKEKAAIGGVVLGDSVQEHLLSVKMHEAVELDRMIDKQMRARTAKENSRAEQRTALYNLELAAGSLGLSIGQDVEQALHQALELMERDAVHQQRAERKLTELDRSMGLVMEEVSGGSDEDLLAEYEKLVSGMEQESPMLLD